MKVGQPHTPGISSPDDRLLQDQVYESHVPEFQSKQRCVSMKTRVHLSSGHYPQFPLCHGCFQGYFPQWVSGDVKHWGSNCIPRVEVRPGLPQSHPSLQLHHFFFLPLQHHLLAYQLAFKCCFMLPAGGSEGMTHQQLCLRHSAALSTSPSGNTQHKHQPANATVNTLIWQPGGYPCAGIHHCRK